MTNTESDKTGVAIETDVDDMPDPDEESEAHEQTIAALTDAVNGALYEQGCVGHGTDVRVHKKATNNRTDETASSQETIEVEASVLQDLAWELLPEIPPSHVQSFHHEIDGKDVDCQKLKPHVEETKYAPGDGMVHFSGETEATVPVNCQTRDDISNPTVKPWPIYFSVALYPSGVGDAARPPEVYLTIGEV